MSNITLLSCVFGSGVLTGAAFAALIYYRNKRKQQPRLRVARCLADLVGETPIIRIPSLSEETGCEIYAKCEWMNPCGSSKDRIAKEILLGALEDGDLVKGGTVVEASSGSTGISLTRIARSLGMQSLVVVPNDQAKEKIGLIRKLGGIVELVKPASIVHPEHNVNIARQRAKSLPQAYFVNQFENEANIRAQLRTGEEIWEQLNGNIDAFVMSAGTAGTIAGVSRVLKSKRESIQIVLADPPGSSLFHAVRDGVLYTPEQSEKTLKRHRIDTIVEGVGLDRMTSNFQFALGYIDHAIKVTDPEVVEMSRKLMLKDGLFVGSSSALNCVATVKLAKEMGPGHVIVTVLCSSGEREVTKLHDDDFCRAQGLLPVMASSSNEYSDV